MAHREKHRTQALLRRAATGRQIKSDRTPAGHLRWYGALAYLRGTTAAEQVAAK